MGLEGRDNKYETGRAAAPDVFGARGKRIEFGGDISERTLLAEAKIDTIEKPTMEDYEKALKHEKEARKIIGDYLERKNLTAPQKKILKTAKNWDHEHFLAMVIKESYLKAEIADGYAQISVPVISELNMMMPFLEATHAQSQQNPSINMAYGLLYLAILHVQYIDKVTEFSGVSDDEKTGLAAMMHNLGPTAVRAAWKKLQPSSVADFADKMEDYVAEKLAMDNPYQLVTDEIYKVPYKETAVSAYRLKTETNPARENPLFDPMAFDSAYPKLRKLLITARYYRVTNGVEEALKKDGKDYIRRFTGEPEKAAEAPINSGKFENYAVKRGENLWRIGFERGVSVNFLKKIYAAANPGKVLSAETLEVGQVIKVPKPEVYAAAAPFFYENFGWTNVSKKGFWRSLIENEDYNQYLKSRINIDREDIVEVVVNFNQKYNPELKNLKDNATNLPEASFVWVPNTAYFKAYFANTLPTAPIPGVKPPTGAAPIEPGPAEPPTAPPELPEVPVEAGELDKKSVGQYAAKSNGNWVLDKGLTKKGVEKFKAAAWENHPTWDVVTDLKGRVFDEDVKLDDVKFVILHSTVSTTSVSTIEKKKAHFVVERDGTIKYLVSVKKGDDKKHQATPHAGISNWNGVEDLNRHSIGIEVVAADKQEWSAKQIEAVKKLAEFLGGYYGLRRRDVLTHYQIAYSRKYGRGRKSDPYSRKDDLFEKLGLPDNSRLLDLPVVNGNVEANLQWIEASEDHDKKAWPGLKAATAL